MKEALKLAQKAMENSNSISYEMLHALAAIKEALAQPPLPVQPVRQPLTDEQIKKATWETSQKLLSFAAENGIAVKGIDEHVIAVGKAAIEAAHNIGEVK